METQPKKKKKEVIIMKCIVETTGNFGLLNTTKEYIESTRPSVTTETQFIDQRIFRKELKVLAHSLPKTASDEEFLNFYNECNKDAQMAVEAYCASLGLNTNGEPAANEFETEADKKAREKSEKEKQKKEEAAKKVVEEAAAKKAAEEEAAKKAAEEEAAKKAAEEEAAKKAAELKDDIDDINDKILKSGQSQVGQEDNKDA